MLNGIDPVIIFQFGKLDLSGIGDVIAKIPLISQIPTVTQFPPIPIYLSERITGVYIESEDKHVEIATTTETLSSGAEADVAQKGLVSSISVNLVAKKDSIGITLLSTLIDLVYQKATSKEYTISYLHGPITIFRGLIQSFSMQQNANNDLLTITLEISKGEKTPEKLPTQPQVPSLNDAQVLGPG